MSETQNNMEESAEEAQAELIHVLPDYVSDYTGYDHLYIMCKDIRNQSSSGMGYLNPITPRLNYIMEALSYQGQRFEFVPLNSDHYLDKNYGAGSSAIEVDGTKLANVLVKFKGTNQDLPTVVFTAHHDIANFRSENCQDNTASVCNLIHLCAKLKEHEFYGELQQNVAVVFTDCEEMGGRGMNMLINQIQEGELGEVDSIFALELTANGSEMWVTGRTHLPREQRQAVSARLNRLNQVIPDVGTPYNESANARRAGLPAVCIGTLTPDEMQVAAGRFGFPKTWSLCHRMEDTFEHSAVQEDMNNFVDMMLGMIDIDHTIERPEPVIEEIEEEEEEGGEPGQYSASALSLLQQWGIIPRGSLPEMRGRVIDLDEDEDDDDSITPFEEEE